MIKVEVTFTNKDGVEETAWGRLIHWRVDISEDSEHRWVECVIVLDDSRIVIAHTVNGEYGALVFYYREQTKTNLIEHEDIELGFNKIIE